MRQQGVWMKWEQAVEQKVSRAELLGQKRGSRSIISAAAQQPRERGAAMGRHHLHCKRIRPVKKNIPFIGAGQRPTVASRTSSSSLLLTAQD
ncbi:hypothetical protein NHX12_010437 [Muraenolepis orangiensis]|uniref:Uncharacterized protein n=1 Tax=Muraenolepis orangiensis TaxID=630683 RepID=A0A9Q0DN47_9TELE|nr:hypothetical protein NHX12_010437 [Muraenolepis orangiensis]